MHMTLTTLRQLLAQANDANARTRRKAIPKIARFALYIKDAAEALVNALNDPNERVRQAAAYELRWTERPITSAVTPLIAALKDPSAYVRESAVNALKSIEPKTREAVAALTEAIADKDIGHDAISALGAIGPAAKDAIPSLMQALESESFAYCAAEALGQIGPAASTAVPLIAQLLKSPNVVRRTVAAEALGRIGPAASETLPLLREVLHDHAFIERARLDCDRYRGSPSFHVAIEHPGRLVAEVALALWLVGQDPLSIPTLIDVLHEEIPRLRMRALNGLSKIGSPAATAIPDIIALTRDTDKWVRSDAVSALATISPTAPGVLTALTNALDDPEALIRVRTARTIGDLGEVAAPAVDRLVELLTDPVEIVQLASAEAIWQIAKRREAISAFARILQGDPSNARDAALNLAYIGRPARRAVPRLLRLSQSANVPLRCAARHAIECIAGRFFLELATLYLQSSPPRSPQPTEKPIAQARRCTSRRHHKHLPTFDDLSETLARFKTDTNEKRIAAMPQLGYFAFYSVPAADALIDATHDNDRGVRAAAATQLGWMRSTATKSLPRLIALLKDPEVCVRHSAAMAIFYLGPDSQDAVPALIEAMDDQDTAQWAICALGAIGPPAKAAIPPLMEVLSNEELGLEAARALGRIGLESKPAVPLIARLLERPGICNKGMTLDALGRIGPAAAEVMPLLIRMVQNQDPCHHAPQASSQKPFGACRDTSRQDTSQLNVEIARAIWRIDRHPLALELLMSALHDDDQFVRVSAIDALAEFGPSAATAANALVALANDPDIAVRYRTLTALAAMMPNVSTALPAIITALKDRHPTVRAHSAALLGNFGPIAAPAVKTLVWLTHKPNRQVKMAAATSLWRITRHEAAITTLVAMLDEPSDWFEQAAHQLAQIGAPACRALPILLKSRHSPVVSVRCAANYAIEAISGPSHVN